MNDDQQEFRELWADLQDLVYKHKEKMKPSFYLYHVFLHGFLTALHCLADEKDFQILLDLAKKTAHERYNKPDSR